MVSRFEIRNANDNQLVCGAFSIEDARIRAIAASKGKKVAMNITSDVSMRVVARYNRNGIQVAFIGG